MKKAFEQYFSKLNNYAEEKFGTKPTITYTDELNKELLVSEPNEDGEVEWQPKLQKGSIRWDEIEAEIGFSVCQELKEYYSAYLFLMLYGKFGSSYLNFYPIDDSEPVASVIERAFYDAQEVFSHSQMFLIGNASVDEDDNFFIYYDNKTGKLFCYDAETKREILLSYSITETIDAMEARM